MKSLSPDERLELALDIENIPHGHKRPDGLSPENFIAFSNKLISSQRPQVD